jgi:hypothetical protein
MVNATELYPNTPTPDLDVSDWDFDPGYDLLMGEYVRIYAENYSNT